MGNCCAANEDLPTQTTKQTKKEKPMKAAGSEPGILAPPVQVEPEEPPKPKLVDLDPPSKWGISDNIESFERSLPFARIMVDDCNRLLDAAATDGCCTLDSLAEQFDSPAWADLGNPDSKLAKFLTSSAFIEEDTKPGEIDVDLLKCWALFHCQGKKDRKAVALYNILQDGGLEKHDQITATDKDFRPNFERLCRLATRDVFNAAHTLNGAEKYYDDATVDTMLSEDNIEALIEDVFLEHVYGAKSRLPNDEWLAKVGSKEGKWIFDASLLREQVFKQAGVAKLH